MIEHKNVFGKDVYIFESHQYALYPWALLKRKHITDDISLFTFDYHTDLRPPFYKSSLIKKSPLEYQFEEKLQADSLAAINYSEDSSLKDAIEKLCNDEHIMTAVNCGIIKRAYIIAHYGSKNGFCQSPNIYMSDFFMGFDNGDDVADELLEDGFLAKYFSDLSKKSCLIHEDATLISPYILDIDLDYFTSKKSVLPQNVNIFSKLVQNAEIITIAKESNCVKCCSKGKVDSEYLLKELLLLLKRCIEQNHYI